MPEKIEHIVQCNLSRRQRLLYDEYINQDKTRSILADSDFFSIMSVLMQLRKVCNHPDLFEARSIESPFILSDQDRITYKFPTFLVKERDLINEDRDVNLLNLNLRLIENENKARLVTQRCEELMPERAMYETFLQNKELIGSNCPRYGENTLS
jgi:helicase SWR1